MRWLRLKHSVCFGLSNHDETQDILFDPVGWTLLCPDLSMRQLEQHNIRACLRAFQDNLTAICGDVVVANIELRGKIGQLSLGARCQIAEPEILVLHLSAQEHERFSSTQKCNMSSSPSQT